MLDEMMRHPAVKKALERGEERVGKLVTQLLSNEKFVSGLQSVVASALSAKTAVDRGVKRTLQAVNLPSTEDVEELRRKLSDLESMLDQLADRVEQKGAAAPSGDKGAT
ncbi:hypothetical protein [Anaeromyxobacter paludicola]|uniref:Uncharacterized protein n=1 Tax=Anaeromyxobacter paludicola TaxID=2918171 RepID=A0ABN6N610_9BACT|nr:hypothetical protein [Anaeromyxobacter paludicola]BDG08431.1 hypothetical protein AMPC_15440 [Anaeromyxobacter paludicola]